MKALILSTAALISFSSVAVAAPVYERSCAISEDAGTKTLFLRTRELQFRAIFEMNAADPQRAEVQGVKTEFSTDHKVENYKGRIGDNVFGPRNATVDITVDGTRRSSAGKSPAVIKFKKFIFGGRTFSAECSDWAPVPNSRW